MMRKTVLANDGTAELAMGMADEMVGFSFFGDGHAGQAEAVCRINTSGGKQKTKRRVSA